MKDILKPLELVLETGRPILVVANEIETTLFLKYEFIRYLLKLFLEIYKIKVYFILK